MLGDLTLVFAANRAWIQARMKCSVKSKPPKQQKGATYIPSL